MSDVSATREFVTAFSNWRRTVSLLMLQYVGNRSVAGRLSVFLVVAEPIIFITMFYIVRVIYKNMMPFFGTSTLLWMATGIFPYFVFLRASTLTRSTKVVQPLPRIRPMDVLLAQVTTNSLIWVVVVAGFHYGMWLDGIAQARPESLSVCAEALFFLLMFGVGVGLINGTIIRFFPFWGVIFSVATRGMVFISGVMRMPDNYQYYIRQYLVWNPLLHGVNWYRMGIYGEGMPHAVIDIDYFVKCAVIALFIGLIADRASMRYAGR